MAQSRIQQQAAGLLSALGINEEPPTLLERSIYANLDGTPFWLSRRFQVLGTSSGTFAGPGTALTLPIPAGQGWYFLAGQIGIGALAAGESVVSAYGIGTPDGSVTFIANNVGRTTVDAAGFNTWGFMAPQPFILLTGSSVVAFVADENVAAARAISVRATGYLLQI